jgi:hypothetical protein
MECLLRALAPILTQGTCLYLTLHSGRVMAMRNGSGAARQDLQKHSCEEHRSLASRLIHHTTYRGEACRSNGPIRTAHAMIVQTAVAKVA